MNKEIEELLNKMKNCNGVFDYYLEYGEVDLLLSYIEQLEKRNKQLLVNKEAEKYINDLKKENQQLKHDRDKALKKLNKYRNRKDHYGLWCMEYIDNADIIHILKGDSE